MICTGVVTKNTNKSDTLKKVHLAKKDNSLAKKSHSKSSSGTLWSAPFITGLFFRIKRDSFIFS